MCIGVLPACLCTMSVSGAPRGPEKDTGSLETGVTVLSGRVDPGTQSQVLWKSSRYSYLLGLYSPAPCGFFKVLQVTPSYT